LDRGARLVFESGRPIAHVARGLGVPSETLRKQRQLGADEGLRPELPTAAEREEIKQLRRENYELRRANEILKAASVFSRPSSTKTGRSERVHRLSPRALRGRADLQGPGRPGVRVLPARHRRSLRARRRGRAAAGPDRAGAAANYDAYGYRRTWKALRRADETVGRDHVKG
jgi:transposase